MGQKFALIFGFPKLLIKRTQFHCLLQVSRKIFLNICLKVLILLNMFTVDDNNNENSSYT